jgi:MFS family permease
VVGAAAARRAHERAPGAVDRVREDERRGAPLVAVTPPEAASTSPVDVAAVQRRTLALLFATQIVAGVGVTIGSSVGALLVAELAGTGISGAAQSASVIGAALLALPATTIVSRWGRRPSLATSYLVAATGALIIFFAATRTSIGLVFAGFLLFGGASAANMQVRYAAVDLAPSASRARHLSLIIWATTLGAVAGPNLSAVAGTTLDDYGVPPLAAPFLFSAVLFVLAAAALVLLLRPDPARLARELHAPPAAGTADVGAERVGINAAFRAVRSNVPARVGMSAMAVGHATMVGVMAMTPVHIRGGGHDAAHTLRIVGVVLSLHIAGMYASSPVIGWLTDKYGRRPIIVAGVVLLIAACALAGTAGHDDAQLAAALTVLGLGWSCTMVAGSTLLSESVPVLLRASTQGLSDAVMGLAGASAGALSGVVVQAWGFPVLTLIAALVAAPFIALAARRPRAA